MLHQITINYKDSYGYTFSHTFLDCEKSRFFNTKSFMQQAKNMGWETIDRAIIKPFSPSKEIINN